MKIRLLVITFCIVCFSVFFGCSKSMPTNGDYGEYAKAIQKEDLDKVKQINKKFGDLVVTNIDLFGNSYNPLEMAALYNANSIVLYLLENNADPNAKSPRSNDPIVFAIIDIQNYYAIDKMLQFGLNVDVFDSIGHSLLGITASTGNLELLSLILANVESINVVDYKSTNALFYAVLSGSTQCVDLLLSKGINIDQVDNEGNTSLMYAIGLKNREMIKILLAYGANTKIVNNMGNNAEMIAEILQLYDIGF